MHIKNKYQQMEEEEKEEDDNEERLPKKLDQKSTRDN